MKTELFIKPLGEGSFAPIDIDNDIPIQVTFSIRDIKEPEKRNSHFSQEVKIPGTKNNNTLFDHIFQITTESSFNVNKKAEFYLLCDTVETSKGVLQLKTIEEDAGEIWYTVVLFAGVDDLFTAIGDAELTDLDFAELNHTYNRATIEASWDLDLTPGYIYPIIDYTHGYGVFQNEPWRLDKFELRPAVRTKIYIDKIFEAAGMEYESEFFDSDFFERLVIPFNKPGYQYTNSEINAREFRAMRSPSNQTVAFANPATFATAEFNTEVYDAGNVYDPTVYQWTIDVGKAGIYKVVLQGAWSVVSTANLVIVTPDNLLGYIRLKDTLGNVYAAFNITGQTVGAQVVTVGQVLSIGNFYNIQWEGYLDDGLILYAELEAYQATGSLTANLVLSAGGIFTAIFQNQMTDGGSILGNSIIPEKVLQKDFLLGLARMFNLYIEQTGEKKYLIEPRDTYYTTEIVDWQKKVDASKEIVQIPMAELQAKFYKFRYKEDADLWNKDYQDNFKFKGETQTYGEQDVEVDNDWVTETQIVQPVFSATPMVNWWTIFISQIVQQDTDGSIKPFTSNIRILYYGGLLDNTPAQWFIREQDGTDTYYDEYPYAGHLDDPVTPLVDLSFGTPRKLYYDIRRKNYTDGNLYNIFWSRAMNEILDRNSKLVTAWIKLNPVDIMQLSFRKLYFLENEYFRLNKIVNFDFNADGVTQCEFIKSVDSGAFTAETIPVIGGSDDDLPDIEIEPDNENGDAVIVGDSNFVDRSAENVHIVGDNNKVFANTENINISGDGNTIEAGISNVVLVNCNGLTIEESDVTYINNCLYECPE